ncbi:Adaptin ear-binding coat-associated protein 1, partial [Trichinella papuae]
LAIQMMDDTYERVLLIKPEAFVYKITLPTSSRGHRAATWKLDNPDWVGRLRLLSIGKKVILKLEDKTSGDLFAECPIESYPSPAYESVIDSSRYFVIRLQDPTGRTAQIGLGFADRGDAFDLTVALRDHFRHEEIADEIKKEELAETNKPKLDLGFKEGETITINIGKKTAVNSDMRSRPKSSALQQDTVVPILLPPPPGHVQKVRPKIGLFLYLFHFFFVFSVFSVVVCFLELKQETETIEKFTSAPVQEPTNDCN